MSRSAQILVCDTQVACIEGNGLKEFNLVLAWIGVEWEDVPATQINIFDFPEEIP